MDCMYLNRMVSLQGIEKDIETVDTIKKKQKGIFQMIHNEKYQWRHSIIQIFKTNSAQDAYLLWKNLLFQKHHVLISENSILRMKAVFMMSNHLYKKKLQKNQFQYGSMETITFVQSSFIYKICRVTEKR